jgi:hypothetical protein
MMLPCVLYMLSSQIRGLPEAFSTSQAYAMFSTFANEVLKNVNEVLENIGSA